MSVSLDIPLPLQHLAIIMDGNGRWAEAKGKPRAFGHQQGAINMRTMVEHLNQRGLRYLTLFAFSTENWKRPAEEVEAIMQLLTDFARDEVERLRASNIKVKFIGDRARLSSALQAALTTLEVETKSNTALYLQVAINYGGRDELVRAFNRLKQREGGITEPDISAALDTCGVPDPDLIIRTGGNQRTSNFLTWQSVYSEWYFTETWWPDLSSAEVDIAIKRFQSTERRFGGVPPLDT